ncbi:hypothetical protein [Desulfosporosinus nitroreducens]|nr:hypothetical protein [Desulfosporosinus nitroreducens]
MAKKKNPKKIVPAKPPPKIKFEDTKGFKVLDRMMRSNKGISGPM